MCLILTDSDTNLSKLSSLQTWLIYHILNHGGTKKQPNKYVIVTDTTLDEVEEIKMSNNMVSVSGCSVVIVKRSISPGDVSTITSCVKHERGHSLR